MAALRLGWAYCPEQVVQTLNKIRPAFNINSYAQEIAVSYTHLTLPTNREV